MRSFSTLIVFTIALALPFQAQAGGNNESVFGKWQGDGRVWVIEKSPSSQPKCGYSAYNSYHEAPVEMNAFVDSPDSVRVRVSTRAVDEEGDIFHKEYDSGCLLGDTLLLYKRMSAPNDTPVRTEGTITYEGPWDSAEWVEIKISSQSLQADVWRQKSETMRDSSCYFGGCGEYSAENHLDYSFSLTPVGAKEPVAQTEEEKTEEEIFKFAEGAAISERF